MNQECQLHINELQAVNLIPQHLEQELSGQVILIESNNTAIVSYINNQGGMVSQTLNAEACTLYQGVQIRAIH